MRKKMIALFLCISTVAALSGCGSSKSSTSTGNVDSAEKLVKLGDYKNIEVEVDKSYEISDNSVQETIENYFLTAPIYTENKEKDTVADGDVANIDYEGTKDGEAFDGGSAKGYNLKIGSGTFIPGFEDGLVGVKIGDTVVVFAQGPIGLCATAGAKLRGATRIITIDGIAERLAISKRMGADITINFREKNPIDEIMKITDGKGVDVAIEALGTQQTFESCLRVLKPGGVLSSLGVYSGQLTLPGDAFASGLADQTIVTTLCPGGKERMRRLLNVVESGRVDLKPLVTHRFRLDQIEEAYDLFANARDGVLKIAITP